MIVAVEFGIDGVDVFEPDARKLSDVLHYGDPPQHGCVGDTMNSVPIRVIEFWHRNAQTYDWERRSELEIEMDCEWDVDEEQYGVEGDAVSKAQELDTKVRGSGVNADQEGVPSDQNDDHGRT